MPYKNLTLISINWILILLVCILNTTTSLAQEQPSITELNQRDSLINELNKEGKYSEAMELTQQHWNVVKAVYSPQDTMYVKAYSLLGEGYYNLREFDKAIAIFEENAVFAKAAYSPTHIKYLNQLYNIVAVYNEQKKDEKTLEKAFALKQLLEENNLTDKIVYSDIHNLFASVWKNKREYKKAISGYKRAIEGLDTKRKKERRLALYSANLARVYTAVAKYDKAEVVLKEAQEFIAASKGVKHENYRRVIMELASLYSKQSEYEKAEEYYLMAIKVARETVGESHPFFAIIWYNLAVMYFYAGDYQKCETAFMTNKKLTAKYRGANSIDYALAVGNLGSLYWKLNRYEEAENLYKESLSITKKTSGDTSTQVATALGNIGLLYGKQKKIIEAEEYYLKSIQIYKALGLEDTPNSLQNTNNLVSMYIEEKMNASKAFTLAKKVLQARKEQFGVKHPQYIESLINLGKCHALLNQYTEAEKIYLASAEILAEKLGVNHVEYIKLQIILVEYFLSTKKDLKKARVYLKEAFKASLYIDTIDIDLIDENWRKWILSHQQVVNYPLLRLTLIKLTELIESENRDNKLEQSYIIAQVLLEILDKNRQEYTTEQYKLRLLGLTGGYSHQALTLGIALEKENQELFRLTEKSKAVLLSNSIQSNKAQQFGAIPNEWRVRESELAQQLKQAKAKLQQQPSDSLQQLLYDKISTLNIQIDSFDTAVKTQYPKYHALKNTSDEATIHAIQQELEENKALISYMVGDSSTYLVYIDKQDFKVVEQKIKLTDLQNEIKKLRKSLSNYSFILKDKEEASKLYVNTAYWFYDKLLAPILSDKNTAVNQLVIIPDGELAHLPFEAFISTLPQQQESAKMDYTQLNYLMKDYSISYHYSAGLWLKSEQSTLVSINNEILAMAASYTADLKDTTTLNTYVAQLREGLSPIPAVQQEVEGLAQNFEGLFLNGIVANEGQFKQEAKNYGIIHLAMHGVLNQNYPLLSAMAMTESKDSTEDDLLEVHEIAGLQLNAELIVLSACETGYGKFEQGNGVASLARAFMYAGANAMVVSLWQVNDQSTAYLMQEYYQLLSEGMNKDVALRQAKLNYINNVNEGLTAHPAFWAPFIQLGNTAPISIATKSNNKWWWIGIGGVALIGLGLFLYTKKRKALE